MDNLEISTPAQGAERWFVFCKRGRPPRFEHASESAAMAEAARLAMKCPGAKFHVLKSVAKLRVAPSASSANQTAAAGVATTPETERNLTDESLS